MRIAYLAESKFFFFAKSVEKKLKNKLNSIVESMNSIKSAIELMNNNKNKLKLTISYNFKHFLNAHLIATCRPC